ncbi:MAG TPA: isopentenyl-diphosphate Delta-isomerase [Candidatus Kapabacteria bacterium]|nr:isopentenyl-diphosphate Delta-isomerase [Candidatus Kapabacteria bacterium]
MIPNNKIALVDEDDNIIAYEDKLIVHRDGLLHRAFSILVFNDIGEILLQRRALHKYHSAGLWSNTCCSHLPENSEMKEIIHTRLNEEMGFDCELEFQFKFTYKVIFNNGLTEYETDHLYFGYFNSVPNVNPEEAMGWMWISYEKLEEWIKTSPEEFTYWFKEIFKRLSIIK